LTRFEPGHASSGETGLSTASKHRARDRVSVRRNHHKEKTATADIADRRREVDPPITERPCHISYLARIHLSNPPAPRLQNRRLARPHTKPERTDGTQISPQPPRSAASARRGRGGCNHGVWLRRMICAVQTGRGQAEGRPSRCRYPVRPPVSRLPHHHTRTHTSSQQETITTRCATIPRQEKQENRLEPPAPSVTVWVLGLGREVVTRHLTTTQPQPQPPQHARTKPSGFLSVAHKLTTKLV